LAISTGFTVRRLTIPKTKEPVNRIKKKTKITLAASTALTAIPVNPKEAVIVAMT